MKFLAPEPVDDAALLNEIASNPARDMHGHPALVADIQQQYVRYVAAKGNAAAPNVPVALNIPGALKILLKGQYSAPPNEFAFIDRIRGSATDACPMCGGTNSSTVDHIFPQSKFAEFAFFSWNLVPACGCNIRRKAAFRGDQPGERILHPYFDTCLADPLMRAAITPVNGSYEAPDISPFILMAPNHAARPAFDYHLKEIVFKTYILRHWIQLWGKFRRRPETYFKFGPGAISPDQMSAAVTAKRQDTDDHYETPNNWDSMLYAALEANADARDYLRLRIESLRKRGLRVEAV